MRRLHKNRATCQCNRLMLEKKSGSMHGPSRSKPIFLRHERHFFRYPFWIFPKCERSRPPFSSPQNLDWHSTCIISFAQAIFLFECRLHRSWFFATQSVLRQNVQDGPLAKHYRKTVTEKPRWTGIGWKRERTFSWFHPPRSLFPPTPSSIGRHFRYDRRF